VSKRVALIDAKLFNEMNPMQNKIVILGAKRTPFGGFGGSFKDRTATDLSVDAGQAALQQAGVPATEVDHVVMGHVVQSSSDAIYLPRHIGLKLGVPMDRGALGVNRLCGSGFQSWVTAAQMMLTENLQVCLAGGAEQMSQIPFVVRGARWGYRMGTGEFEDYLTASLTDQYAKMPMAMTAEKLAEQYKISREDCDQFAVESQNRYKAAAAKEYFATEISAVTLKGRKGPTVVTNDEHPKADTTVDSIKGLRPVFKEGGVVTAANASGIVDGAAMSVLTTEAYAKSKGARTLATLRGWAVVGCDPTVMGIGPAYAIKKLLAAQSMQMKDIDLFEVNEAFAAQYLAVEKEIGLPRERTNVNGGAIAVGHPLGASGTRIMNHLCYELERRNGRFAIGSACIGGGQGIAVLIEREKK
jgi:acetyl-CoA acetyltransferase family protein